MLASATAQTVPVGPPTGADTAPAAGENITVTGTRIKTTNATSDAPITVITSAQIEHTSAQTLEDVLTQLPEIGTGGVYSNTNNGGDGSSCIDLRNLGIERTLVLVDGKRFVHTAGGVDCVDLNNIPLAMVERIEVLKDGASSTYGADAVAGVINIILKHNFNGVVFKADGLIGTDDRDDQTGDISVTAGTTFNRGNFTVGAEYLNRGPVYQANRNWALNPVQTNNPLGSGPQTTGSFYTPNGTVVSDVNTTNQNNWDTLENSINKSGTGSVPYTGNNSQRYDFGADQVLSGSLIKESLTSFGTYDFNDNITGYVEEFYTHKESSQQLAPQPVAGAVGTLANLPDAYVVPEGNPYLTALLGPNSGPVDLYKRETQFGDRQYSQYSDTYQFNGGFKGDLGGNWNYEVFFQYGQSDNRLETLNSINFQRLEQEAGFQQTTATADQIAAAEAVTGGFDPLTFGIYNPAVCVAATGCVLSNPFGQNLSAAAVAYAKFTQIDTAEDTLKVWGGTLTNSSLINLPAGPLGLSLGVEHRSEFGEFSPDALVQTGVTETAPAQPTKGSFSATEVYGETLIPLLKDLPGAKDLHINVGGRFFNYNTFGSGETWKVNGVYVPVTGIKFRASDGTAFRQPSITDLYDGQSISYVGAADPCGALATYTVAQQATIKTNCLKQGVNPATFTQIGSQIQTIVGGNPNLQPETARTQTVGVVFNPPFIPRSALTFDYFRTKIANNIGSVDTQDIVNGCYESDNFSSPFCKFINPRLGTGQLSTVVGTNENLGVERTEGLDIGANYTYVTQGYGAFTASNDATYVFKFQSQNLPNGPFIVDNGTIGTSLYSQGFPRLRDNFSLDWRFGDFQLGYRMRYIDGMLFYPLLTPSQVASYRTPQVFYHDIVGTYDWRNFSFNVGIDNVFDKSPPYVNDTTTNTDPSVYDVLGRLVYVKITARF
jgi:outer membrane receptor protein involved in Fe transport